MEFLEKNRVIREITTAIECKDQIVVVEADGIRACFLLTNNRNKMTKHIMVGGWLDDKICDCPDDYRFHRRFLRPCQTTGAYFNVWRTIASLKKCLMDRSQTLKLIKIVENKTS